MMEGISMVHRFKRGRFYKLLKRVEAIPAGVYRFEGGRGSALEFSVGRRRWVRFVVREVDQTLIEPVTYRVGLFHGMSEHDFCEQVIGSGEQEATSAHLPGKRRLGS